MKRLLPEAVPILVVVGLAFAMAWFLTQPYLDEEAFAGQAQQIRDNIPAARIQADAAGSTEPYPTNRVLPKPENALAAEYSWRQLLSRDSIAPIYDPAFVPASKAGYDANALVIGVAINGEAKAYPIGPLNGREMVNDMVGGIPVLVTW